ncbi:hypothetical protein [Gordonia sp. SND2]|uniref:hypothetical protein n=1 Tax=Gordonia sp. SND2 TaxID=3388659 RepID=UPI00398A58B7
MSTDDVVQRARQALEDPADLTLALNPEPLVRELADEAEKWRAERNEAQAWAEWFAAKARWLTNNQIGRVKRSNKKLRAESVNLRNQQSRTMSERARLRTERDELRATVERVREANECLHAHRFDLDQAEDAGHDAWLESLGERRAGGPDVFYNGVEFAHRRICRALDGKADRG